MSTLRELAAAATPGPWQYDKKGHREPLPEWQVRDWEKRVGRAAVGDERDLTANAITNGTTMVVSTYNYHCCDFPDDFTITDADAAYIAAVDPQTVLALLDRIDELERAAAMGRITEGMG